MNPQPVTLEKIIGGNVSLSEGTAFIIAAVYIFVVMVLPTVLVILDRDEPK